MKQSRWNKHRARPNEIAFEAEVLSRCEIFSPGAGFVFNTIHNVLPNTPVENFIAMIDAVQEFKGRNG